VTKVVIERLMIGAAPSSVWEVARDLTGYPRFMDQVMSVDRRQLPDGTEVTDWRVLFNGNELQWTEVDEFFADQRRMTFQQLDGDLAEWRGSFQVLVHPDGVVGRYEIEFDLGVPALELVLHPLGEQAIRSNCEQMLQEMEARSRVKLNVDAAL
jgi:hypothetical protein